MFRHEFSLQRTKMYYPTLSPSYDEIRNHPCEIFPPKNVVSPFTDLPSKIIPRSKLSFHSSVLDISPYLSFLSTLPLRPHIRVGKGNN